MNTVRVIPVIDIMAGQVVRAVGGDRGHYQPLKSALTNSAAPIDVARALMEKTGAAELYLADLDAIAGQKPAWTIYEGLKTVAKNLWIDAGVRSATDAIRIRRTGAIVVAGLET